MRTAPFYFEIKDIITQFVHAFDNVVIKRFNKDRVEQNRIKVRYVYSPKQRVVFDLTSKNRHFNLPVIAVNVSSISRDESRVFNKLEGAYFKRYTTNSGALSSPTGDMLKTDHVLQPVPINIEMNMSILAKYQSDVDQIISNFIPYNDPYIVISWKLPDDIATINQEIRSEVLWSGSISLNYPTEIDPGTSYRVGADTSFTVKGWLFKKPLATHPVNNIYTINTSYTPTVDLIDLSFNDQTEKETIITTVSAVPSITYIDPSPAYVGYPTDISLFGYMFETVSQIVVSGSPDMFVDNISAFNFNSSADTSLSSLYPEYSGVEVTYDITNDNYLIFTLPAIQTAGNINVIISNQAGYTTTILPVSASDLS